LLLNALLKVLRIENGENPGIRPLGSRFSWIRVILFSFLLGTFLKLLAEFLGSIIVHSWGFSLDVWLVFAAFV
jgi:hypothetical protein